MTSFIDAYNNDKYWKEQRTVRIVFPNESCAIEIEDFNWNEFKVNNIFDDVVFGWWGDTYIKMSRKDYDKSIDNK